ncbi:MAG: hypothetical protein SGILL_006026 [Bacillariaceae sp.]
MGHNHDPSFIVNAVAHDESSPISSGSSGKNWWRGRYDVSNKTHPHLGAIHPDDKSLGWIVDPSVERLRPVQHHPGQPFVCPKGASNGGSAEVSGIEGKGGNKLLLKVQGGLDKAKQELLTNEKDIQHSQRPKVLCMIYAMSRADGGHGNLAAIADTWGRRCDGFIGFSNLTDHSVGAIDFYHDGPETIYNMWQKVRAIWTYAFDHYLDEFEYFYIAGDDVYMAVENLRVYVEGPEVKRLQEGFIDSISSNPKYLKRAKQTSKLRPRPLMFSTPMMWERVPVIAGGAGYMLNQAALQVWGEKGADHFETDRFDSKEDFLFGKFLADQNIFMSDTHDDTGAVRFSGGAEFGYHYKGVSPVHPQRLKKLFGWEIKKGMDSRSEQQISFHLKDDRPHLESHFGNNTIAQLMIRYHAILNHWCDESGEAMVEKDAAKE